MEPSVFAHVPTRHGVVLVRVLTRVSDEESLQVRQSLRPLLEEKEDEKEEEENEENEQSTSSLQSFVVMFLQRRHFCVLFLLLPLLLPREKAAEK